MEEKDFAARSPLFKTPLTTGLYLKSRTRAVVWMPSIKDEKKRYPFRPNQIRFLHAFASGVPVDEICAKLEMSQDEAFNILKRKRCREYLQELDEMDAEMLARTAKGRIAKEILEVWDGKSKKSREQLEAAKELWSRIWPKPEARSGSSSDKVEINISVGPIEQAKARKAVIDAEIVK